MKYSMLRVTEQGMQYKQAMQDYLLEFQFTHHVTLNLHAKYTIESSKLKVGYWSRDMVSRLFKRVDVQRVEKERLFFFFAFPELTHNSEPHFHLLLQVAPERCDWFERVAADNWKKHVPSGTCCVQRIGESDGDRERVIGYDLKCFDRPFSHESFFTSGMLINESRGRAA